jgi:acetyl-CoA acetyltransferase
MIADPFTQLHCCVRTDGGGAVVLAAEDRARDCAREPVWILGSGQALSHVSMSQWEDFTESPCLRSGAAAFGQAGVTSADIDVWALYDSFTYTVLATLEGLGVCKKGEGGSFVEDGRLRPGGSFALNPACRPAIPACVASSCWWRPSASCAANAGPGRSTMRGSPWSTPPADFSAQPGR